MIVYPAIDVKDGNCVRLKQGKLDEITRFNTDLVAQAREFESAGFSWLHMVDLDGAFEGQMVNQEKIIEVIKSVRMQVQIGGGIRDLGAIRKYIDAGAARVILGTVAIKNFALLEEACKLFPGKVAVGIDAKSNKVATDGWVSESDITVFGLIDKLQSVGVSAIIYTDISKDGLLSGFDESGSEEVAKLANIPLIVSGGVSSLVDINRVKSMENSGVSGVIVGRAFYDNKISYDDAIGAQ